MAVHTKLEQFRQWVDVDVNDSPVRNKINTIIDDDMSKDSPTILNEIDGKYSPYRDHLSKLGNTKIDLIKCDSKLAKTALVAMAVIKFRNLKNRKNKKT